MGIPVSQVAPERAVAEVVKGEEISGLDEKDWDRILAKRQIVFARTSPQQKLIM
jgi:sodium/potassium-transporting ATPase subunit alpha